jgi:hypothetical protein
MSTFSNFFPANPASKFYCDICDYNTSRKCNYDEHLLTAKHKKSIIGNLCQSISSKNQQSTKFMCLKCNKEYKDNSGLWRHKKKCSNTNVEIQKDDKDELIMMLIKDNSELKNMMMEVIKNDKSELTNMIMEVIKNGTHNTSNTNSHNNSHNKAFNLNFFLNETCKDAMNIMDFVDSIKLQLSDLERVGEFGFVDGISNIIVQNLKALDVTERPIHCTDKKREVLYVKDENKWEKDEDKNKIKKAIKRVANKNIRLLPAFKQKYPDCNKSASIHSDQYNKMIVESMDTDGENENKIITNISKQVLVEKETTVATI